MRQNYTLRSAISATNLAIRQHTVKGRKSAAIAALSVTQQQHVLATPNTAAVAAKAHIRPGHRSVRIEVLKEEG